jgi:malonyl-CoA O-methyltransferase
MHNNPIHSKQKLAIARNFSRAANTYNEAAIIQQEIGKRLLDRLELIKMIPDIILDLGGGTGAHSLALSHKFPRAKILNVDIAEGMLQFAKPLFPKENPFCLCADGESLPIQSHSIDFVFSNCSIQWLSDPRTIFAEVRRILKPNGFFLFSSFGQDTLKELKESFAIIDTEKHVNDFADMHDIGDILLHTKFLDPVMDMEIITVTYPNLMKLLSDLKMTGANFVMDSGSRGLSPKNTFDGLNKAYEHYRNLDNRLPASFEVIYGHAFAPIGTNLHQANDDGTICIPVEDLKRL